MSGLFFDLIYYFEKKNFFNWVFLGFERGVGKFFQLLDKFEIFSGGTSRIRSFLRGSFFFGVTVLFKNSASQLVGGIPPDCGWGTPD